MRAYAVAYSCILPDKCLILGCCTTLAVDQAQAIGFGVLWAQEQFAGAYDFHAVATEIVSYVGSTHGLTVDVWENDK